MLIPFQESFHLRFAYIKIMQCEKFSDVSTAAFGLPRLTGISSWCPNHLHGVIQLWELLQFL
ncbi:hypothetical protein T03_15328 [Trichinella britovi]|uniref:Uncharacterized protein n=1 Tax=Trichinella britovi TaxID=45882 RepID=A0A0V1C5N7_TRIBR|nr:hypothetical protein T03_15328 [Trichinella britovi]